MNFLTFLLLCSTIHVNGGTVPSIEIIHSTFTQNISTNREPKSIQTLGNINEIDSSDIPNVCTSAICLNESIDLLKFMDQTIDPCENFYNFVCAKYVREYVLPEDKSVYLSFYDRDDKLKEQLRDVLTEKIQPNEPHSLELAKKLTKICLNERQLNAAGIEPLLEFLDNYGGWPVVKGDQWNENQWDWLTVKRQVFEDGFLDDIILEFSIRADYKNSSKQTLFIDRPDFGLSEKFLLEGLEHARVRVYYTFMVDAAVIFGANRDNAEREMLDVLQFETDLAKISLSIEERRNISVIFNVFNMTTLQGTFPFINWLEFINWNLNNAVTINENESITVPDVDYLHQLNVLLHTTPKRTISNYFGWRLVFFSADFLDDVLHKRQQQYIIEATGMLKPDPRLTECIKKTTQFLPISASATYIRKYFNEKSKEAAILLARSIHKEFIKTLKKVSWMDESTRREAIAKANAMGFNMGYPDELTDHNKLEEYYRELELQPDSLLHSVLRIRKFTRNIKIKEFRMPIIKNDWRSISSRVTEVDAFYIPSDNSIQITAGILQDHFFKADRPSYMNFGTIGSFVGHEVTHGFDDNGRQLDANGNFVNWWDNDTLIEFTERAQCFIDKYSKYKHPTLNLTVNGVNTLGENIADVGGLKAAYGAYQTFVRQNKPEPILPGLYYTPNQLFWISAAKTWCAVTRPEFDMTQYTTDEHTPFNYRINGAFNSLPQFANDFNCPPNSPMNPINKCEVW